MANGMQFNQNSLALAPSGQSRREQMAQALMANATSGRPVQGGLVEALSRVGQAYFANQTLNKADQQREQRRQALADTLQRAVQSAQPGATTQNPMVGPSQMSDAQRMAAILAQNPDTAGMGAQIQLSQALQKPQAPQAQTRTISGDEANKLFGTQLAPGAAVTVEAGQNGTSITNVQAPQEQPGPASVNAQFLAVGPDGQTATLLRTTNGIFRQSVDANGRMSMIPVDSTKWMPANLQGSRKDIGATSTDVKNFHALESRIPVLQRLANRVQKGLDSGEYVGGISGSTVTGLNSLRNQVSQLYDTFNQGRPQGQRDVKLDLDKFRPAMGKAADMSNQVQSALVDLAYMTAKAKDPSGRISDKDLENELKTYGLNTSDPSVIMKRVNQKIGDLMAVYRAQSDILGVKPKQYYTPKQINSDQGGGESVNAPSPAQQPAQQQDDPLGIMQ